MMKIRQLLVAGSLLLAFSGPAAPAAPAAAWPLVPARLYVADWDGNGAYQLSPDGQRLMWNARRGLRPGLYVKDLATGAVRDYAVPFSGSWARDSRQILFNGDSGDENAVVLALDGADPAAGLRALVAIPGRRSVLRGGIEGSDDLLIESNRRLPAVFDLYRYQAADGTLALLAENPGDVTQWVTDASGAVRARVRQQAAGRLWERATADGWQALFTVTLEDTLTPLSLAPGSEQLWALSNRGRDKLALVQLDLASGAETVRHADPEVDLSEVVIDPRSGTPLAVATDPGPRVWTFFDPALARLAAQAQAGPNDRLDLGGMTRDGRRLVAVVQGQHGGRSLLLDADAGAARVLGDMSSSRIDAISPRPPQQPLRFVSRDGLTLHAYLTAPVGADGAPLPQQPTVVVVHGGPWSRDLAYQDNLPFFLANRGYAVLQVNYRGSSGYGKAFEAAGVGEFGGRMQDDLLDGVAELVRRGVTDPRRVAIMGASYGGYAALAGMTLNAGQFACGISLNGMSDLARLLREVPPYWELGKHKFIRFVGDPDQPAALAHMQARSPLALAGQLQGPLLIGQGVHDPRVRLGQSVAMVARLRAAGKPVTYVEFPHAGHQLYRWNDQLTWYRKTEDFLAACLGGRSRGFDLYELANWWL